MDISHGYAPWKGGPNDQTASKMGDADIDHLLGQGKTGAEMLAFYEANPDKQGGGGIGGGVHKRLQALAASQSGGGNSGGRIGTEPAENLSLDETAEQLDGLRRGSP